MSLPTYLVAVTGGVQFAILNSLVVSLQSCLHGYCGTLPGFIARTTLRSFNMELTPRY